jgi:hypothetical protein
MLSVQRTSDAIKVLTMASFGDIPHALEDKIFFIFLNILFYYDGSQYF